MRQLLEAISTRERLRAFWQRNLVTLAMLRQNLPDLKSDKGEHYAEILTTLYKQQMRIVWEEAKAYERKARELAGRTETRKELDEGALTAQKAEQLSSTQEKSPEGRRDKVPEAKSGQPDGRRATKKDHLNRREYGNGSGPNGSTAIGAPENRRVGAENRTERQAGNGRIDKTNLPISTPRRVRDKEHLRYVASQPCIICGRSPGQAHHLRFAQPRALGRKVSDEWTVPLCSTHHGALHSVGNEEQWWTEKGIDPIAHAVRLWWDTHHGGFDPSAPHQQAGQMTAPTNRVSTSENKFTPMKHGCGVSIPSGPLQKT